MVRKRQFMSLYVVTSGSVINSSDINQLVNVLSRPSGAVETVKYFLTFGASTSGVFGSVYIRTLSQGATPVSVSVDAADQAATNCGSLGTANLTAYGFQITAQSTTTSGNCRAGGNFSVQY